MGQSAEDTPPAARAARDGVREMGGGVTRRLDQMQRDLSEGLALGRASADRLEQICTTLHGPDQRPEIGLAARLERVEAERATEREMLGPPAERRAMLDELHALSAQARERKKNTGRAMGLVWTALGGAATAGAVWVWERLKGGSEHP